MAFPSFHAKNIGIGLSRRSVGFSFSLPLPASGPGTAEFSNQDGQHMSNSFINNVTQVSDNSTYHYLMMPLEIW